jgi:hypothetical protein
MFRHDGKKIRVVFLLGLAAFCFVMLKAGFNFSHHSYYIVPFVPVMALVCGYGISTIPYRKAVPFILIAISAEGILNQKQDFFLKDKEIAIASLEQTLDKFSSRNDLIVINSGINPAPVYFAHRRGWIAGNEQLADPVFVRQLATKNCKYIIVLKKYLGSPLELNYLKVFDNEHFTIYKL